MAFKWNTSQLLAAAQDNVGDRTPIDVHDLPGNVPRPSLGRGLEKLDVHWDDLVRGPIV